MARRSHSSAAMNALKHLLAAGFVFSLASIVACSGGSDTGTTSSSSSSSGSSGSSKSGSSSSSSGSSQDEDPTEENGSTSSSSSSSSSGSTTGKPSGATNVACQVADDCGYWFCDCKDASGNVSPVNSRSCKNGWCMDAATSCPSACSAFGKTWTGTADGGPDQK